MTAQPQTAREQPPPACVPLTAALHRASALHPDRSHLICRDRALDYRTVTHRTAALARGLAAAGIVPGDRVALLFNNSLELPLCLLACWQAGAIAVPINARFAPPEISYILEHSAARLLIGDRRLCETLEPDHLPPRLFAVPELEADNGQPSLDAFFGAGSSALSLPPPPQADAPALIIYTSGSTARPKGVVHSHRTLALAPTATLPEWNALARLGVMTPMFHISGLFVWMKALSDGATAVLIPAFDAGEVLDTFERHRCELTICLPLLYQKLLEAQRQRPRDLAACTAWLAGGDSVTEALQLEWRRHFPHPLIEGCAMTELLPALCNSRDSNHVGSFGRPMPGVEAKVCADNGDEVPDGATGQLLLRAAHLFCGYWRDPAATAAAIRDGWFWTGDLGARSPDGSFSFKGRIKQLIVRGGAKIAPQEVEAALVRHPGVADAAVVGRPDATYGETVAAFVVPHPGRSPDAAELTSFLRTRLAAYKVPEYYRFLDTLPKGPTGKADRRRLRDELKSESGIPVT